MKKFYLKIESVNGFNWISKLFQNELQETACILEFHGKSNQNESDINIYADCILQNLDFVDPNSDVVIFSKNVYVTNTVSYWLNEVSETHDYWAKLKQKLESKNIKVSAFTEY